MDPFQRACTGSQAAYCPPVETVLFLLLVTASLFPASAEAQDERPSTRIEFLKYGAMATHVDQSPDGRYIAIGARNIPGRGSRVVLWNQATRERVRNVAFSGDRAPRVAFDSAGSQLAVAPARERVSIWPLNENRSESLHSAAGPVHDLAFGPRGTLAAGAGSALRIWSDGPSTAPTVRTTNGPVRSLAVSTSTSDVVFISDVTHLTLWNYRLNTTKRIDTFERCEGVLRQVAMTDRSNAYVITERRAEGDPDYLCRLNLENGRLLDRLPRKNISHVEPLGARRVAYSRGRYVYTLNLQTREERIVFHSDNDIQDLSYANDRLVVANSDVVVLDM